VSRVAVRLVTAAFVVGSAALGLVPVAHADSSSTLVPSHAAWYQPNPTCAQPSGCLTTSTLPAQPPVDVPLSPYPAGTIHVGYDAGQETARAYLGFPVGSVMGTATAASLDVPLDVAAADGSTMPETAHLQACLVAGDITSVEGSIAPPPTASCAQHAVLTYVATPAPHFHADLAPLLSGLLTTSGLALLPDATAVTPTDAWRVVFSSASRTGSGKTDPPVLTLSLAPSSAGVPQVPVDVPTAAPVTTLPGLGVGIPSVPAPTVPSPQVQVPTVTTPQIQPVAAPRTITVGYAYPAVWLLPLVFLVLVPLVAGALTRDLTPAR
jgi:hypothetical protein